MTQPLIDTAPWPLVMITFAAVALPDEVDIYLKTLEAIYQRGNREPFVTVADMSHVDPASISAALRQKVARGLADLERRHPHAKRGEAVIIPSGVARAAYTAVNLMRPRTPYERKVFANKLEAREWARALVSQKP